MGRPKKPWWNTTRKRWCATVNGIRVTAPSGIGKRDTHAAWEWHRKAVATPRPIKPTGETLAEVAEAYLAWDEGRVKSRERDGASHVACVATLTRICATEMSGGFPGDFRGISGGLAGDMLAQDITPETLEALVTRWSLAGVSPGYRRALAARLKAVLAWAARPGVGLLPTHPLAGVALPPCPVAPECFAQRSEAAAWLRWLWRNEQQDQASLQRCLIHTGARPSELVRATWADIRWESGVLILGRWKSSRRTGRPRRVYLPSRLLRSLRRRFADADGQQSGLIWTTPTRKPWTGPALASALTRLRAAAVEDGVPILIKGPERLRNYRWRHTAASSLIMQGVPVATVAELLGTSPNMIARTYSHLLSDHLSNAAEILARRKR